MPSMLENDPLWYKDAIVYEVHVRAFADSTGLGLGDFRGLTGKLDYLADLGVTAVWLLPFYPSPLRDDGYDIADYTGVHPQYGTLADFRAFLDAAHAHGIRVITELVINHTSDAHPWFQRARRSPPGSRERDFYVWSDTAEKFREARIIFKDFERSNWTWDPVAHAYYWHRFYAHQPDLNYDNPAVWDAIFPVVDFWLGLGVDGLRLDAVPYLYEREGTNCENLPETHAFLKALRKHVDERFPNRMLLAEANQWPEDAVAYFGAGDECQMCFHFPVMPRLFMALHREDRFPLLDILAQTPSIPDNCQWGLFLRNHDELTLEMVTDEERDYMYRAYASDPEARINLGIRHRLAPLLGNDRRRIELMKALLFSLPGTPVLYYGDEIGMGDNIYLGDRNGVRTPMQWSADRNAGFSRANPQKLYLPVIIDPEYHFEAVNVEAQQNNPSSLLWWTKRLIALRKRFKAFGRGTLEFLRPDNFKVLAFVRRFGDERILVVANLSRFVQHAELDLRELSGLVPEELFGRSRFPPVTDHPYPLTLGPHSFYWFALAAPTPGRRSAPVESAAGELPTLSVRSDWTELLSNSGRERLQAVLPDYLHRRHAGAGRPAATSAQVLQAYGLRFNDSQAFLVPVRVERESGLPETDLLPLTFVSEERAGQLLGPASAWGLARLAAARGPGGILVEALADPGFCRALLEAIAQGRTYPVGDGEVAAVPLGHIDVAGDLAPLPRLDAQDNAAVVYGDRLILKVFRRIEEGVNPELELGRFLTERQGFGGAAPVAGAVVYRRRPGAGVGGEPAATTVAPSPPTTLAVLHRYVPNQGDAWQLTLDQLSSYFERVLTLPREGPGPPPVPPLLGQPDGEDRALVELIGPYLDTANLLGRRTAELHTALAADASDPAFAPEPFTRHYQRSLYQSLRTLLGQVCIGLTRQRDALPEAARPLAQHVLDAQEALMRRCRGVLDRSVGGQRIRCHGDYHLGHLLNAGNDFIVIDFEGNPDRSVSERRIKRSPLTDVAALLRSLHHAAQGALHDLPPRRGYSPGLIRAEDRPVLAPWAAAWYGRVVYELLAAYVEHVHPAALLPETAEGQRILLELFVLQRALEELGASLARNPEGALLPLLGVVEWV
jgi:maltose alpha-D-glucosyltransferase/alpha-amylase